MIHKLKLFLEDSRQELKRVNWPTREETIRYTVFVIVFSLGLAAFLGFFDYVFIKGLTAILS